MTISEAKTFNLLIPCELAEVRSASERLRQYLQLNGLSEVELSACELAVVEALNNAIQYVSPRGKSHSVRLEAICTINSVIFRVIDHTRGFSLPDRVELPPSDVVRGRGLFLIKSAMDEVSYESNQSGNCLTMKKSRGPRS